MFRILNFDCSKIVSNLQINYMYLLEHVNIILSRVDMADNFKLSEIKNIYV